MAKYSDKSTKTTNDKAENVLRDFKYARENRKQWVKEATEDLEFTLGKQWKDEDAETLRSAGVIPLTINKLHAYTLLLSGIQRQNRTDFNAFPKGDEDQLKGDIATLLIKSAMDDADGTFKLSECFETGVIVGEGWLEPYIDYTNDMLSGNFGLKQGNPFMIYPDPSAKEYDLSDAEFIIKFTPDLTKGQLYKQFPKKKSAIDKIAEGKLDFDNLKADITSAMPHKQYNEYNKEKSDTADKDTLLKQATYDLTEYYYKKYEKKYYVADKKLGAMKQADSMEEAERYVAKAVENHRQSLIADRLTDYLAANPGLIGQVEMADLGPQRATIEAEVAALDINPDDIAVVIERVEPEIWVCAMVGTGTILEESVCWSYPKWKNFPFIRYLVYSTQIPIDKKELQTQGLIRQMKPLQIELNKRRTQELRHLNSTANSGWLTEEDSWVDATKVEKYGSTPGVSLEYKTGKPKPEKQFPQPLSTGHTQLAIQATQDMKEVSGVNTDLLAMQEGGQASGRAIALRQKQGLVMVQKAFDNFSRTQRILGRFILSILGEIYTIDTATKICGDEFIKQNFQEPVLIQAADPTTGQPVTRPQVDENTGEMVMQINPQKVADAFNDVLINSSTHKFDIVVGEGANTETVKFANYMLLMELIEKGIPIPPDVLIDESNLTAGQKEKIKKAIEQAQRAAQAQAAATGG